MLDVIETIAPPARYLKDANSNISVGNIVSLIDDKDHNLACTLCKGEKPFGIVTDVCDDERFVYVLINTAIIRTDQYEKDVRYRVGKYLYSSDQGLLTSFKKNENCWPLGHIILPPSDGDDDYLEFSWI